MLPYGQCQEYIRSQDSIGLLKFYPYTFSTIIGALRTKYHDLDICPLITVLSVQKLFVVNRFYMCVTRPSIPLVYLLYANNFKLILCYLCFYCVCILCMFVVFIMC